MYKGIINKHAHTIAELLVASVIIILIFASSFGAFLLTKGVYRDSIESCNIQRDVNILLATMIRGIREQGGGTFGLRSAASIPSPGLFPSPGQNTISFVGTDTNTRRFFLSNNTVIYDSPTQIPRERVIYTAPANSNIVLRFTSASADQQLVYVYVSVTRQVGDKIATGSAETDINLRNIPK